MAYYRDLDLNFGKHPITNDVSQLTDIEAVKRSIRNLLQLKKYEKPFHPEINPGVGDLLFENPSSLTIDMLRERVSSVIRKYETRAKLIDVRVISALDSNSVAISIIFTVAPYQNPTTFNVNLVRNR